MADPTTLREMLVSEALGEAARLIREVEVLAATVDRACQAQARVGTSLNDTLSTLEGRMTAITEHAKVRTVQHMAMRTDEATRQAIEQQKQAMADTARAAFRAELGNALLRLQALIQASAEHTVWRWEHWLVLAFAVVASSASTCILTLVLWTK